MYYELAYQLRMPLHVLLETMPYTEMLGWFNYFEKRPVGWRDDLRTAYMLQAQGVKKKPGDVFPSLRQLGTTGNKHADSLKNSAFYQMLMKARGGEKVSFL